MLPSPGYDRGMQNHHGRAAVSIEIDADKRRRVVTFRGVLTDEQLVETYAPLISDPQCDSSLDDLIDLRGVTDLSVTSLGMQQLLRLFRDTGAVAGPIRVAIVADTDAVYGVARMYQALHGDDARDDTEVFHTMEEAEAWLDRRYELPGS